MHTKRLYPLDSNENISMKHSRTVIEWLTHANGHSKCKGNSDVCTVQQSLKADQDLLLSSFCRQRIYFPENTKLEQGVRTTR